MLKITIDCTMCEIRCLKFHLLQTKTWQHTYTNNSYDNENTKSVVKLFLSQAVHCLHICIFTLLSYVSGNVTVYTYYKSSSNVFKSKQIYDKMNKFQIKLPHLDLFRVPV